MRPSSSSSSDPNAPYRDAIARLADCNFFAPDAAEQVDTTHQTQPFQPPDAFAALVPRHSTHGTHLTSRMAEAPPSSAPVTLSLIEQYLTAMGHGEHFLRDSVIEERLDSENLSTKTLFDALQIAHDPNHPLFCNLQLNVSEQMTLINKLVGILTNASGFRRVMQTAARNSNDNPYQFILGLLQFIRG